jgi:carboxypeptidase Q
MRVSNKLVATVLAASAWCAAPLALAQSVPNPVDTEMIERIKLEGSEHSQVMETISYLTDVHGARVTGSPYTEKAADWTLKHLEEWGLENCHLESWGPFGRGWTLEGCTVNMVEPRFAPLIAHVKAWSPGTSRSVKSVPIYLDAETPEELEAYRGKLGRAIVLIGEPRELPALFEPPASRQTDDQLLRLANAEPPAARGGRRSRTPASQPTPEVAKTDATSVSGEVKPPAPPVRNSMDDIRASMKLRADKWEMAYREGAAVILEPGRGDGGNVFVASVTMPTKSDDSGAPANAFSRGPRPWATDATDMIPQAVMAAEHYNQLVRMLQKGVSPELEVDIVTRYHNDTEAMSFNILAEIPGTDLADEIVMLGAHFDSWQSGTGATDNAVGCGVAMEAIRILKAIDARPRRTIRLALWTGEEQGLLGSRAYVEQHFGKSTSEFDSRQSPSYEIKPEQEKISAYYNLDNGTGAIRGIYLQGNEQLRSIFRSWLTPFSEMGATTISVANTGGTDHQSFDAIGIPGFQFIQDKVEYDSRTHHSSMDVYERIQESDVKQASVIMASFVYQTAIRDELLPRKQLNGTITKVDESPTEAAAEPAAVEAAAAATE